MLKAYFIHDFPNIYAISEPFYHVLHINGFSPAGFTTWFNNSFQFRFVITWCIRYLNLLISISHTRNKINRPFVFLFCLFLDVINRHDNLYIIDIHPWPLLKHICSNWTAYEMAGLCYFQSACKGISYSATGRPIVWWPICFSCTASNNNIPNCVEVHTSQQIIFAVDRLKTYFIQSNACSKSIN